MHHNTTNNLMPMNDYILLGIIALISIGGGLYLLGAAKRYRRREDRNG